MWHQSVLFVPISKMLSPCALTCNPNFIFMRSLVGDLYASMNCSFAIDQWTGNISDFDPLNVENRRTALDPLANSSVWRLVRDEVTLYHLNAADRGYQNLMHTGVQRSVTLFE